MLKHWMRCVALLLAAVALVACSGGASSPEAAATAFVKAMYDGDGDKLLKLARLPSGERPGELEMAQGKLRAAAVEGKARAAANGGVQEVTVKSSRINEQDPTQAVTVLTVRFKNGQKEERVRTVKEDGNWKVRLF